MQNQFSLVVPSETREELLYWIGVSWSHYRMREYITHDAEIEAYCRENTLFLEFINALIRAFPESHTRSEKDTDLYEVHHLFALIGALPFLEKNKHFNHQSFLVHQKANTLIYRATQEWLFLYEQTFGYFESPKERMKLQYNLIRIHTYSYLFRTQPKFILGPHREEEKIYYPKLHASLNILYKHLHEKFPSVIRNKKYLMERYTHLILPLLNISQFEKNIRLYVSFSNGSLYERIAQEKILTRFRHRYNIRFVQSEEERDILITDISSPSTHTSDAAIIINYKVTERDYHHLENIIQNFIISN